MAAPTVTRPIIKPPEATSSSGISMEEIAKWAKWVVLAIAVFGIVALVAVLAVSYSEQKQNDELRQKWDSVFAALKDKKKPVERITALEEAIPKVAGSPAHAVAAMELGNLYFEQAVNAKFAREERNAALDKATKIYEMLAKTEPFKSNPAFGPMAVRNAATAYEQAENYDEAIKLLSDTVAEPEMSRHFMYNELEAQLGREYWLRSLKKAQTAQDPDPAKREDPETDRREARKQISEALRSGSADSGEEWRREAEFIRALTEKPGKALPDGVAPPEKVKPREADKSGDAKKDDKDKDKKDDKKDSSDAKKGDDKEAKKTSAGPAAGGEKPAEPAKSAEPAKVEPAKPDNKAAPEKKPEEPKKDGSINLPEDPAAPASPSGHLTFSQLQKLLKEGRPAFCNCPRCQAGNAPPAGVRLAE